MGNRIYSLTNLPQQAEHQSSQYTYIDLDSVAMYDKDSEFSYVKAIAGFIKYIMNHAGIEPSDSIDATIQQVAQICVGIGNINAQIQYIQTAFSSSINYTYDEIFDLYNEYMSDRKMLMKRLLDVNAVRNSIKQIFTWIPGERILNPEFGSRIRVYLYEQITDANHEKIISEIRGCVSKWEPRANIIDIRRLTTTSDKEQNTVNIEVKYRILGLDDTVYSYVYTADIFNGSK